MKALLNFSNVLISTRQYAREGLENGIADSQYMYAWAYWFASNQRFEEPIGKLLVIGGIQCNSRMG